MYVEIIIFREVTPPKKHVLPHRQILAIAVNMAEVQLLRKGNKRK